MGSRTGRTTRVLVAAALLLASLTACGSSGDLTFSNEGTEAVTVTTDHETLEVPASSGTSLLGNGVQSGDVTVTFASGSTVTIAGPVCPDELVVIRDGSVDLRSA